MTTSGAPAGWYPDPAGSPQLRYFDGGNWTEHLSPRPPAAGQPYCQPNYGQPNYGGVAFAPWKGANLGRPPYGPGSLANPGRRLGAQLIDGLVMLPFLTVVYVLTFIFLIHGFSKLGPDNFNNSNFNNMTSTTIAPAVLVHAAVSLLVSIVALLFVVAVATITYEGVATARYGRTLGKAALHIRPLRTDGSPLSAGRAFGRAACRLGFGFVSVVGLLDFLWCLWDADSQCLHDKVVGTVVVNDQ